MPSRIVRTLVIVGTLGLAACSGSGPTTGSLLGTAEAKKPATDERTERALQVGATSARATRCGYNFDPAKLRQAYLAYENSQGGTPEQLAKLEKAYDFTRTSIAQKIAQEDDFCSDAKTKAIKTDLNRHLAGDFSPPPKKVYVEVPSGWFGTSTRTEPLDREKIFDPRAARGGTY